MLLNLEIPTPPSVGRLALELPRASRELLSLADWRWYKQFKHAPRGNQHVVMTLPGFGGGDGSMAVMRHFLQHLGYRAEPWGLGTNVINERVQTLDEVLQFCQRQEAAIIDKIKKLHAETGEKVSLVGWSMGGVYANSLAQTHPDLIRQVILLGAPVGDPRGTSVWNIMRTVLRGKIPDHLQNVDGWVKRRDQQGARAVRTTIVYSRKDGAVAEASAIIEGDAMVENIHLPSSHLGFAHNPAVYWLLADRLSQSVDKWQSFDIANLPKRLRNYYR